MNLYNEIKVRIDENKSFLKMAELHMDERAIVVIKQRIFELEKQLDNLPSPAMVMEDEWIEKLKLLKESLVDENNKVRDYLKSKNDVGQLDMKTDPIQSLSFSRGKNVAFCIAIGEIDKLVKQ